MDEGHEPRDVCGVEDDDHMAYVWAIGLDVLTQLSSDLGIALEEVFACHPLLAWSTTRGDYILSTREGLLDAGGKGEVETLEATVTDFLSDSL